MRLQGKFSISKEKTRVESSTEDGLPYLNLNHELMERYLQGGDVGLVTTQGSPERNAPPVLAPLNGEHPFKFLLFWTAGHQRLKLKLAECTNVEIVSSWGYGRSVIVMAQADSVLLFRGNNHSERVSYSAVADRFVFSVRKG